MERLASRGRTLGLAAVGVGIVSEYCMYDVDAGQRVVIFDSLKGVLPGIYGEGTRFKWPWQVSEVLSETFYCSFGAVPRFFVSFWLLGKR